jgi:leader peptidase (prepilin peptidase)/N-methyltransferase
VGNEHARPRLSLPRRLAPSARRQLVGAAAGGLAGAVAAPALGADPAGTLAASILGAAMFAIAFEDALRLRVPDRWVALAVFAGLAWAGVAGAHEVAAMFEAVAGALLGGAVCAAAFLLLREGFYRLRGLDGLGMGDVKLAAAGGVWLGWHGFAVAVLAAAAAGIAVVGLRALRAGGWRREQRLSFGALLAPAIWCAWLSQQGGWAGA